MTINSINSRVFLLTLLLVSACGEKKFDAPEAAPATEAKHEDEHKETNNVTLSEAAFRTAQIVVQEVGSLAAGDDAEILEVPGQVEIDPRRIALVSSRVAGRIERLNVVEGDRVQANQTVGLLFSTTYLTAQTDLMQAARRARTLAGTADEAGAKALLEAAKGRLRLLGATDAEIEASQAGEPTATLSLRAPISGSITESKVLPGAAVSPGDPIFTISDLTDMDVIAEIPERALPEVHVGQRATVSIAAFPEMQFKGSVERMRDVLNAETRTLRAVIHVGNGSARLRPGMFATVRLEVSTRDAVALSKVKDAESRRVLTIPESAIITDGERKFVFVETGERAYEKREVRVTALSAAGSAAKGASTVMVQDGLRAGERVVTSGAFILKSELAKASLSDEH